MLTNKTLYGLLGSLVMAAGLPASASDKSGEGAESTPQREPAQAEDSQETVRIVVSLPNGRKYVIEQKVDPDEKSGGPLGTRVSRVLPDGSRISYGTGMTSSRSASRGRGASGTRRAGGGGVNSAGRSSLGGAGGGGGLSTTARSGGGGGGGGSAGSGGGGSAGSAAASSGGGGIRAPHQRHTVSEESAAKSPSSGSASGGRNTQPRQSGSSAGGAKQPVPTIGSPRYDDNGATGGQNVTFHDAGISAMAVGRNVYIWGADIVQSSVDFGLIEGERMAFDGAVVRNHRTASGDQPLTSSEQMYAPLRLEFRQGETVTLTLHSRAENQDNPSREIRNWTFRVR